jgi:tetratricopeptide (TPR) repeat protein
MRSQWPQSEASYRACAGLSTDTASQAQALYCVGVACHQQGNHAAALDAYHAAVAAGPGDNLQPMLALGTARALQQQGQLQEAAAVADRLLQSEWACVCAPPVAEALKDVVNAAGASADDAGAAAASSDVGHGPRNSS